jgi:hypothetical protein
MAAVPPSYQEIQAHFTSSPCKVALDNLVGKTPRAPLWYEMDIHTT